METIAITVDKSNFPSSYGTPLIDESLPTSMITVNPNSHLAGYAMGKASFKLSPERTDDEGNKRGNYPFMAFLANGKQYRIYGDTAVTLMERCKFVVDKKGNLVTVASIAKDGTVTFDPESLEALNLDGETPQDIKTEKPEPKDEKPKDTKEDSKAKDTKSKEKEADPVL